MYAGEVLISAVDESGDYQIEKLEVGDIWYFPKGEAHTIQGMFQRIGQALPAKREHRTCG